MHVILRGGASGPNYAAEFVRDAGVKVAKAGLPPKIMVGLDCFTLPHTAPLINSRLTAVMEIVRNNIRSKQK